ncbi:MAG TPA: sigma-70 family RNA polymerase sigma factor [Bacillota bacterium]|nr:sigma-70 family RNA polymerase sigma factor [Bacillota bacterium]
MDVPQAGRAASPVDQVWAQLLDNHLDDVYRYILRRVGQRADAEDLTHEVFLRAWRWLDPVRTESEVGAWLVRVARSVLAEHWRARARDRDVMASSRGQGPADSGGEGASERVHALLSRLRSRYRLVLELRFLDGLSVAEVAGRMQLSAGNVRILQYRALRAAAALGERGQHGEKP